MVQWIERLGDRDVTIYSTRGSRYLSYDTIFFTKCVDKLEMNKWRFIIIFLKKLHISLKIKYNKNVKKKKKKFNSKIK